MQIQNEHHSFTGMQRDLSSSKHSTSFLYDAKNIRLTPREGDTMFAITNERGTEKVITLKGNYLGHCLLNNYLVVFTHKDTNIAEVVSEENNSENEVSLISEINEIEELNETNSPDIIYSIDLKNLTVSELRKGDYSFNNFITAIGSYENAGVQKVYWTDGENQPRIINIADVTNKAIDFVPSLSLQENISVDKILGTGEFPSGVIQYAFTYYNKYLQESNIFYVTPLQYISYAGRAGSPEDKIANAFKLKIQNVDTNFDYLRIYSILRTSLNGTPVVKRIQDIPLNNTTLVTPEYKDPGEISGDSGIYIEHIATEDNLIDLNNYFISGTYLISGELNYISNYPSLEEVDPSTSVTFLLTVESENKGTNIDCTQIIQNKTLNSVYFHMNRFGFGPTNWDTGMYDITWGSWKDVEEEEDIVEDNNITDNKVTQITFVDDGLKGDIIDPTELLYKGGEPVIAKTIIQKDNTLFLGNIKLNREYLDIAQKLLDYNGINEDNNLSNKVVSTREGRYYPMHKSYEGSKSAEYGTATLDTLNSNYGALSFKYMEYYRLGLQFQHESGKWSEPYWIGDKQCTSYPEISFFHSYANTINAPHFKITLDKEILSLLPSSYKKIRGLFVPPTMNDRTILCQGVTCPTVYKESDRFSDINTQTIGTIYAQSSWLFRPVNTGLDRDSGLRNKSVGVITNTGYLFSHFKNPNFYQNLAPYLHRTEIMGKYKKEDEFMIDNKFLTMHSPDVLFDDSFKSMDFTNCKLYRIGYIHSKYNYGDISIQTSSPTIGSDSSGFIHYSTKSSGEKALISGWFYNDRIVDDIEGPKYYGFREDSGENSNTILWPVFMWHKNGSLNNDVNREGRSAELLKKKISNYKLSSETHYYGSNNIENYTPLDIKLFSSDQLNLIKVNGKSYLGNIDTLLIPEISPYYLCGDPLGSGKKSLYALAVKDSLEDDGSNVAGLWELLGNANSEKRTWEGRGSDIGNLVKGLTRWSEGISMKYKSTPHLVLQLDVNDSLSAGTDIGNFPLVEIRRDYNKDILYGGTSKDALYSRTWIPCGPPVNIPTTINNDTKVDVFFKWGDTFIQRYDCLKTYPFTPEDKNQVIDILSFVCETRVNIDGRYDRNRGQISNLNVSPENYNLINKVYSQLDNFFSYRILDPDYYNISNHSNQITWTKEKQPGADVDLCTSVSLASTYDLDGSRGEITSLNVWNDSIYCFQNKGISNILFNSRVQIPTSDNVPIEISNSYKLDGHRYISDNIGCDNHHKIKETPSGIYFIDSISNRLFNIGKELSDITTTHNMSSWFKYNGSSINKLLYDNINSDLYLVTPDTALCFSEVLGQFTSFMDYGDISLMESCNNNVFTLKYSSIHRLFTGEYNKFFGEPKEWKFTFISNGVDNSLSDFDKIFSNIDYRLDIKESGEYKHDKSLDYIRVENEYQDTGEVQLVNRKLVNNKITYSSSNTNLKKKFRVWRIQIPRDKAHKMDRIRNTWCKITLGNKGNNNSQTILHDLNVQYYV